MPSLSEMQHGFTAALFHADRSVAPLLHATRQGSVDGGLAIYRNNVYSNYRNSLSHRYAVVERLVGEAYFRQLCDAYITATPSLSGDVRDYGADYADFLRTHEVATMLPYLGDVAALEWQCGQVLASPRGTPPDLSLLTRLPAQRYQDLRVRLCPACALLASPYPVLQIWQMNQCEHADDDTLDLEMGPSHMLVLRHLDTVSVLALDAAEHAFLSCLQQGQRWGEALQSALAIAPDFDLGSCLLRHINNGAISRFIL